MKKQVLVVFTVLIFLTQPNSAFCLPWNISDESIPYFAMLRGNSERSFLVVNPVLCSKAPQACKFFSESMNAHRQLNHLIQQPSEYTPLDIATADCFAVHFSTIDEIRSAYELMLNPDQAAQYKIAGDLNVRANHLKVCSKKKNKWFEH